jgi:hypothetical protein
MTDDLHYNVKQFRKALLEKDVVEPYNIGQKGERPMLTLDIYNISPELAKLASFWDVYLSPCVNDVGCKHCSSTIDHFEVWHQDD